MDQNFMAEGEDFEGMEDFEGRGRRKGQAQPRDRAITNMQRGTYSAFGEAIDWTYYDTATLAATTTPLRMFQAGLTSGKTLDATNFPQNGMIPAGQNFQVWAVKIAYIAQAVHATADLIALYKALNAMSLELVIGNKAPLYQKNVGDVFGAPMFFNITPTAAGDNLLVTSVGRFIGIEPLNKPIILAAMTPFAINVTPWTAPAAALAGDFVRVSLLGKLDRLS
jgi:hypothetical protein